MFSQWPQLVCVSPKEIRRKCVKIQSFRHCWCLQTSSSHPPVKLAEKAEQTFSPKISSLENQGFSIWLNIQWIRDISKQVKMSKQCYQSRLRWFGDSIGASIKVGKQKVFLGELYLESRAFETRVLRVTTNFLWVFYWLKRIKLMRCWLLNVPSRVWCQSLLFIGEMKFRFGKKPPDHA